MDQTTTNLGQRYDVIDNVALKFQWDRVETYTKNSQAGTGGGLFVNAGPDFKNESNTVDLYNATMDFTL
jgi:hypothetical protein